MTGLVLQFSTLVWLAAASLGTATSTRVANRLGRGDARGARATALTATSTVLVTQAALGAGAYLYGRPLLSLMTSNPQSIDLAMQVNESCNMTQQRKTILAAPVDVRGIVEVIAAMYRCAHNISRHKPCPHSSSRRR